MRRLEAEDREHRQWRRSLFSPESDDPVPPVSDLGAVDQDDLGPL